MSPCVTFDFRQYKYKIVSKAYPFSSSRGFWMVLIWPIWAKICMSKINFQPPAQVPPYLGCGIRVPTPPCNTRNCLELVLKNRPFVPNLSQSIDDLQGDLLQWPLILIFAQKLFNSMDLKQFLTVTVICKGFPFLDVSDIVWGRLYYY